MSTPETTTRGRKRGRPPLTDDDERLRRLVFLRGTGATLAEIGAAMDPPVSGERVRQLLARAAELGTGTVEAPPVSRVDPLQVVRAIRIPEITSLGHAAAWCGVPIHAARRVVRELGMTAAVARYFRWKRRYRLRQRLAARIAPLAHALGRWPTFNEALAYFADTGGTPHPTAYRYAFGDWFAAGRWCGWDIAGRHGGTPWRGITQRMADVRSQLAAVGGA